jgi:hypothetical protein
MKSFDTHFPSSQSHVRQTVFAPQSAFVSQLDRALTLIFPGGAAYYTEGSVETQPGRMELLARLLERGIHPKLTTAQAKAAADKIRAGAAKLKEAVDTARMPTDQVTLCERVRTATARVVHFELANYKRALVSAGYSETEIHEVIPDRTPKKKEPTDK